MARVAMQSASAGAAIKSVLHCRFVVRFIVNSVFSAAGLISIVLTGTIICLIAAIDPALEALHYVLITGWSWSLSRMWSLTTAARNRQTTATAIQPPKKGVSPCKPA